MSNMLPMRWFATVRRAGSTGLLAVTLLLTAMPAQAFKFEDSDAGAREQEQARQARIADKLSVDCRKGLKDKKIMVVVGETHSGVVSAVQSRYGPIFDAINRRLRALGLRTFTQEEIRKQVAQAEIDAYFRNDPDAAIAAAKKLGASFTLRGLINSHSGINPVLRIDEVSVSMAFSLASATGATVSNVSARSESFSGTDTLAMALTLVEEKADEVVAQLYHDYCTQTVPRPGKK